jgi:hypothetical protein
MSINKLNTLIEDSILKDSLFGSGLGLYEEVINEGFGDKVRKALGHVSAKDLITPIRTADKVASPTTGHAVPLSDVSAQTAMNARTDASNAAVEKHRQLSLDNAAGEQEGRDRRAAGGTSLEPGAKSSLDANGNPIYPAVSQAANKAANQSGITADDVRPQNDPRRDLIQAKLGIEADASDQAKRVKNATELSLVQADTDERSRIGSDREDLKDFRLQNNQKGFIGRFLGDRKANKVEKELGSREQGIGKFNGRDGDFATFQQAKAERAKEGARSILKGMGVTSNVGTTSVPQNSAGSGPGPSSVGPAAGNPKGDVDKTFTSPDALIAGEETPPEAERGMHAPGGSSKYYKYATARTWAYSGINLTKALTGSTVGGVMGLTRGQRPR